MQLRANRVTAGQLPRCGPCEGAVAGRWHVEGPAIEPAELCNGCLMRLLQELYVEAGGYRATAPPTVRSTDGVRC